MQGGNVCFAYRWLPIAEGPGTGLRLLAQALFACYSRCWMGGEAVDMDELGGWEG